MIIGIENIPYRQLSEGNRRAVAVLATCVTNNAILLLDEPFVGLDMLKVRHLCLIIDELSKQQPSKVLIITTHSNAFNYFVRDYNTVTVESPSLSTCFTTRLIQNTCL